MRFTLILLLMTCPALASAQSTARTLPLPAEGVRDAGTYHVATGTWTRRSSLYAAGPQVVYSNDRNTGAFLDVTTSMQVIDHGRLPGLGSPAPNTGSVRGYGINGFQLAYCTRQRGANLDLTVQYYERYAECSALSLNPSPVASFNTAGAGLPGSQSSGVLSCWLVTIDLQGTTAEFCLAADGDETYDGGAADKFGWSIQYGNVVGGPQGPVVAGSCASSSNPPGAGTYYNSPGLTGSTTGLGSSDFFWIEDTFASSGCFFFGGCEPSDANPYASFWQVLFADTSSACGPIDCDESSCNFCPGTLNSTGAAGRLQATGSLQADPLDVTLTARQIPNTFGLLFFGTAPLASTPDFGEGVRCVGGATRRVFPVAVASNNQRVQTLNPGAPYTAPISAGTTLYFQYWFREVMGAGDLDGDGSAEPFGNSGAISVTFQ